MKQIFLALMFLPVIAWAQTPDYNSSDKDYLITISTDFGTMKGILFDDTPLHKENFIKLAKAGALNGNKFYRVIDHFMIQGGDYYNDKSKDSPEVKELKRGGVPAEILYHHNHVKGSIAAARSGDASNPNRVSSKTQFYLVENRKGVPHLDSLYSVFGQVIVGLNVIDSIAAQPVSEKKRPFSDIDYNVSVEEVLKSDIERFYNISYSDIYKPENCWKK